MNFKDLFSRDSAGYAEFRPRYPAALFDWLAEASPGHTLAWDAGTGSGQAAVELARHFDRVIASDPGDKQLANAVADPRVEYRIAGETAGLAPASADLATVAQALHWFDRTKYWSEVKRVVRPGGVVAVWCYELQQVSPDIDAIINRFYRETVGPYWTPERKLVEQGYRTVEFPFAEFAAPSFEMTTEWSLPQQLGYLGTWSAVGRYRDVTGRDPVPMVAAELEAAWERERIRTVSWPLSIRAGRV